LFPVFHYFVIFDLELWVRIFGVGYSCGYLNPVKI